MNSVMFISSCTELGDVGSIVRGVSWSGKLYQETVTLSIRIETFSCIGSENAKKNDSRILGVKIKHVRMPPYTRVPSLKKVQKEGGVMSF